MKDIKKEAENLITYAKKYLELKTDDEIYVKNRVLEVLSEGGGEEYTADEKDEIYGLLSLMPSGINRRFKEIYSSNGSKAATEWFYNYCELGEIERIIEAKEQLPPEYAAFKLIYDEVTAMGGDAHKAMQKELGSICNRILENTAVFKDKKQTVKFLTNLGFEI